MFILILIYYLFKDQRIRMLARIGYTSRPLALLSDKGLEMSFRKRDWQKWFPH